jgi:hypothetical protein
MVDAAGIEAVVPRALGNLRRQGRPHRPCVAGHHSRQALGDVGRSVRRSVHQSDRSLKRFDARP